MGLVCLDLGMVQVLSEAEAVRLSLTAEAESKYWVVCKA